MPRPTCPRRITHCPPCGYYKPAGIPLSALEEVLLEADEMESLRLADAEGMYNQDAAQQMGVSRQTFERILKRAREKVASALSHGMAIRLAQSKSAHVSDSFDGSLSSMRGHGVGGGRHRRGRGAGTGLAQQ